MKCKHTRVYHTRGPEEIWVLKEPRGPETHDIAGWTPVVWEVCIKCGYRDRIAFKYVKGEVRDGNS